MNIQSLQPNKKKKKQDVCACSQHAKQTLLFNNCICRISIFDSSCAGTGPVFNFLQSALIKNKTNKKNIIELKTSKQIPKHRMSQKVKVCHVTGINKR